MREIRSSGGDWLLWLLDDELGLVSMSISRVFFSCQIIIISRLLVIMHFYVSNTLEKNNKGKRLQSLPKSNYKMTAFLELINKVKFHNLLFKRRFGVSKR